MAELDIFTSRNNALINIDKGLKTPRTLDHFDAHTLDDALRLLDQYGSEARIFAGGLDVLSLMKSRLAFPRVLVNIKPIPDMSSIYEDAEGLKIGSLTSIRAIEKSALIKAKYPLLNEAAYSVAAPTIRNMATLGGNLCQQVRCWYYRRSPLLGLSFNCKRKGGEQCYAADGENQFHAVIGGWECHAVSPSDMAPALIALGSKLKISGIAGDRVVPLSEFYTMMGNILKPGEIITEVIISPVSPEVKQKYLKFRLRKTIDFAISSVAAVIAVRNGIVEDARIVLGGVCPVPYRALKAEELLKGKVLTQELAELAGKAVTVEARPLEKNLYKLPITEALVKRAILS